MRISITSLFLFSSLAFLFGCAKTTPPNYFPETGRNALHQRSLDLRSNLKVLSIALQPGFEDEAALAYFRLGRGAAALSVYFTNGEAGESDVQGEYPPYLAAARREEATRAMAQIGVDVRFLNMPDIAAANDSAQVRELWPSDTLNLRLGRLISAFKPDLILVARDWQLGNQSWRWQIFRSEVLATVKSVAAAKIAEFFIITDTYHAWPTPRVLIDAAESQGIPVPVNEPHPRWKKRYSEIGEGAAKAYASLAMQRRLWRQGQAPSYVIASPERSTDPTQIDAGLPLSVSSRLRNLEIQIEYLTAATLEGKTGKALPRVAALIDSVDLHLRRQYELRPTERRTLLGWKNGLENLRCTLLGIEVDYTVTDTVLTDRQLTYVHINKVKNLNGAGATEIRFPSITQQGWVINEDMKENLPLQIGQEYRLLTPQQVEYNFPPALHRFQPTLAAKQIPLFIIHRNDAKEQNFVYRNTINFAFAPKFVAEVLTPIVRIVPNERVVLRLMNISRDGVADTIEVADSLATSFRHPFRLSSKGAVKIDTLHLAWSSGLDDGTYVIPVLIDGVEVAKFAARRFRAEVDAAKRAGLLTGIQNSPTAEAMRRLNMAYSLVEPGASLKQQIETLDVLIIDRRALTLKAELAGRRQALDEFVNRGGHLIVLAQDAAAWNAKPLWEGMTLTASALSMNTPVQSDAGHPLLAKPNFIAPEDWNEWLFWRAHNQISGPALASASVPVKALPDGQPLIVVFPSGNGKRTYVDLALHPQLMNVHAGAFRLLANLVSY